MKKLIIAEKPSVGRDIAKVLKCSARGDGYLFNDEYIVSWAVGHLVTLWDPEEYDENLKKWRRETLPIIPEEIKLKAIAQTKQQLNVLKKLASDNEVESLICATDSGREGELIFRYIYEIIKCKKPFKRLWISSMTDQAIKQGFDTLKDSSEYDNLYLSARCRSEADWLVGINASRAFTLRYNTLLSIGRVQTPTLAIIVTRQKEIDSFDIRDYWEIEADFGSYKGLWFDPANNNDTKIFDKKLVDEIKTRAKGKQGIVSQVEQEEKKNPPPFLYDLTELQRDCNKKFGYSASETLSIAQDLYEKRKMITYPRTDSRYLSDDMIPQLSVIAKKIEAISEYSQFAHYVTSLSKLPITKRIVDNSKISDHHAIIPTNGRLDISNLSEKEFRVFDLVARRFLAVFYPYYVYSTTKIVTRIEQDNFLTRGTTVIDKGWTALNVSEKSKKGKKEQAEVVLPDVKSGDSFDLVGIKDSKKKTKPPQPYNDATLLSAMENAGRFVEDEELKEQLKDSGLGTPATRAAIIDRLIQVGYVVKNGKSLVPTEKAMKLIAVCPPELKSPETTGKWEKGLSSVAKGKMNPDRFMASIKRYVCFLVDNAENSKTNVMFPTENYVRGKKGKTVRKSAFVVGICPNCGGTVLENSKSFYCSNWKNGCKFSLWKNSLESHGVTIDKAMAQQIIKNKSLENVELIMPNTREKAKAVIKLKNNLGALEISALTIEKQ